MFGPSGKEIKALKRAKQNAPLPGLQIMFENIFGLPYENIFGLPYENIFGAPARK
jgi:hypothetical protein